MSKKPKADQPAEHVRMGTLSAAIWRNDAENGPFYTVTVERRYNDGTDWKSTSSFGRDDLLVLGKVLDRAHTRIYALQAADRQDTEAA